ncbi:MAG: SIS domain-containing protein [Calditrichaceae bacterium]|nr:SIS domain-containing protein [Calditrichaceae bacterium]MBN2708430.1 SIS domain-containing protein [Calditrichaceae bacterium]
MDYQKFIENHLKNSADTKLRIIPSCSKDIQEAVLSILYCFKQKGKLLICGNGGSAADAQHIAAEFVIRLSNDIQRPALPAIALTTDTSQLTAGGNDIGFKNVFARQLQAYGAENDVLLGISTSGNSENIIVAVEMAKKLKMKSIGLLGKGGGRLAKITDQNIIVPSDNTQHIQEGHITIGHIICELVERNLFT